VCVLLGVCAGVAFVVSRVNIALEPILSQEFNPIKFLKNENSPQRVGQTWAGEIYIKSS
jgi:hypothetical protein